MIPTLTLLSGSSSMKKPVALALAIVAVLMSLPIVALISVTNIAALGSSGSSGSGSSSPYSGVYLFNDKVSSVDLYDYGNCTYWASLRRAQINEPIPQHWGDAIHWADNALIAGYLVDHSPSFGAIMQDSNAPGGLGHVAFVENVSPVTGAWTISEMNAAGWDEVDQRTFPASADYSYNFIHEPLLGQVLNL